MNKRGFLATLAAMCVAPFAAKAGEHVPKDHVFYDFAEKDGAIIDHWVRWNSPGRKNLTALGHYKDGTGSWNWTQAVAIQSKISATFYTHGN